MGFEQARIEARRRARMMYEKNVIATAQQQAGYTFEDAGENISNDISLAKLAGYALGGGVMSVFTEAASKMFQFDDVPNVTIHDFIPEGFQSLYYTSDFNDLSDDIDRARLDMKNSLDIDPESFAIETLAWTIKQKGEIIDSPLFGKDGWISDFKDFFKDFGGTVKDIGRNIKSGLAHGKRKRFLNREWGDRWYPGKNIRGRLREREFDNIIKSSEIVDTWNTV